MSIFVDGKLKPGTYKVQNLAGQTYLEVEEYSKELCCRPATVLAPQDALWEFQASESGYSIKKARRGKPDQFCNGSAGMGLLWFGGIVSVAPFPAAWRVEIVDDAEYRGFGYVRVLWGSTNKALDLSWWGSSKDGTKVALWDKSTSDPWRIWKLIPVQDENPPTGFDAKKDEGPPAYQAEQ